ncbi:MAG: 2-oxoacid:acceptor oxidoreductase subunit alpha [Candidatus Schekmanbacteria bacterium]|nr:2-oxoacid:acceptor oxidoreductase subunit alpha [Candidatus Schekmanbacteria bacterium]
MSAIAARAEAGNTPEIDEVDQVVVRFAGDSGDGIQLAGTQFSTTAVVVGNDIATFPDYPAEIRAPAGSLPGVSGYQIHLSSHDIRTPGDSPNVLVAMNPAALKTNLPALERGGIVIVNSDAFTPLNLQKAGYADNPLSGEALSSYRVIAVPISTLNFKGLERVELPKKQLDRCKNFFALGLVYWMFDRPLEPTLRWIQAKFRNDDPVGEANAQALREGYHYGETIEAPSMRMRVGAATFPPGVYRNITGNGALALGLVAASALSGKPLFYGTYPITPASDILHDLSRRKEYGVRVFQAEDEIAAIGAAIGAAYGGALAVTGTSGPGLALKSEAIGLAVMTELPLVILDVQRAGPSTGMPTKTEQSDLLQAIYGRNGESPVAVLAAATPSDCFDTALEACRLALELMTPVILLSDAYLGNAAEPWKLPELSSLRPITISHPRAGNGFLPYARDPETMARPWAIPGTPQLEHRIGGLEKADGSGQVSYDPHNHEHMVAVRAERIARISQRIAPAFVYGAAAGDVLIVSWGGTKGAVFTAVDQLRKQGLSVAAMHLRHLNPLPGNVGEVLGRFRHVLVAELNRGQLLMLLRARYLVGATGLNKVQGLPFRVSEIVDAVRELLGRGRRHLRKEEKHGAHEDRGTGAGSDSALDARRLRFGPRSALVPGM